MVEGRFLMKIKQIEKLLIDIEVAGFQAKANVRVAFDYDADLAEFLRAWGYNFCVQDDAFGVQIVVSDANHTVEVDPVPG
jgi:hypothetical protein